MERRADRWIGAPPSMQATWCRIRLADARTHERVGPSNAARGFLAGRAQPSSRVPGRRTPSWVTTHRPAATVSVTA